MFFIDKKSSIIYSQLAKQKTHARTHTRTHTHTHTHSRSYTNMRRPLTRPTQGHVQSGRDPPSPLQQRDPSVFKIKPLSLHRFNWLQR